MLPMAAFGRNQTGTMIMIRNFLQKSEEVTDKESIRRLVLRSETPPNLHYISRDGEAHFHFQQQRGLTLLPWPREYSFRIRVSGGSWSEKSVAIMGFSFLGSPMNDAGISPNIEIYLS
jgi:hypothetical protein